MPIRGWTLKSVNKFYGFRQSLPKIEEELEEGDDEEHSESGEEPHAEEEVSRAEEEEASEEEEEDAADGGQNEENRCVLLLTELNKACRSTKQLAFTSPASEIVLQFANWCQWSLLGHAALRRYSLNFQGAHESIPRKRFRQPMKSCGPLWQRYLYMYSVPNPL